MWEDGESFLNIEHDIEVHSEVFAQLLGCERCGMPACEEPWCVFPFPGAGGGLLFRSLGCTRFGAEMMKAVPDLFSTLPVRDWRRLDTEIAYTLEQKGFHPHFHWPPVPHHHYRPERNQCDCGAREH